MCDRRRAAYGLGSPWCRRSEWCMTMRWKWLGIKSDGWSLLVRSLRLCAQILVYVCSLHTTLGSSSPALSHNSTVLHSPHSSHTRPSLNNSGLFLTKHLFVTQPLSLAYLLSLSSPPPSPSPNIVASLSEHLKNYVKLCYSVDRRRQSSSSFSCTLYMLSGTSTWSVELLLLIICLYSSFRTARSTSKICVIPQTY